MHRHDEDPSALLNSHTCTARPCRIVLRAINVLKCLAFKKGFFSSRLFLFLFDACALACTDYFFFDFTLASPDIGFLPLMVKLFEIVVVIIISKQGIRKE